MIVKWRHCAIAERDHRKDVRNYAHTYHYPQTICFAKAFWQLPREYRDGIVLHEIGHLLAGPDGSESDANEAIFDWIGARIEYVDSPYGRRLERVKNGGNMAGARIARRRRNPIANEDHLPYDEWIPSHAVKFNSDGTVDLMTESGSANPYIPVQPAESDIFYRAHEGLSGLWDVRRGGYYSKLEILESGLTEGKALALAASENAQIRRASAEFLEIQPTHVSYNAGMVQNIQGYTDKYGFHPIRWDSDYDPEELEEPEPHDYTISPSRKFYAMSGEMPPRSRKKRRR